MMKKLITGFIILGIIILDSCDNQKAPNNNNYLKLRKKAMIIIKWPLN